MSYYLINLKGSGTVGYSSLTNSIRDRSFISATFGRGFSNEVKISYADDMGVWFFGLNVCNFRRILLIHFVCSISRCLRLGGIMFGFGESQYL